MLKVKNSKSDKELVAHDYKDGKIAFNPGSQTGAQKSDYMFNTKSITIPGSNFVVSVPANSEREFDVADNSIGKYQMTQYAKDVGLSIDESLPNDILFTVTGTDEALEVTCNKTYAELKKYGEVFESNILFNMGSEQKCVGTSVQPTGLFNFLAYPGGTSLCYNSDKFGIPYIKSVDDVRVYFEAEVEGSKFWLGIYVRSDDVCGIEVAIPYYEDMWYAYFSYENGAVTAHNYYVPDDIGHIAVGFDKSFINYLESEYVVKNGYRKQLTDCTLPDYPQNLFSNVSSVLFGGYLVNGDKTFVLTDSDLGDYGDGKVYAELQYCLPALIRNDTAVITPTLNVVFTIDENNKEIIFDSIESNYGDIASAGSQEYDDEFAVTISIVGDQAVVTVDTQSVPDFTNTVRYGKLGVLNVPEDTEEISWLARVPRTAKKVVDGEKVSYIFEGCLVAYNATGEGVYDDYMYANIKVYYPASGTEWVASVDWLD